MSKRKTKEEWQLESNKIHKKIKNIEKIWQQLQKQEQSHK